MKHNLTATLLALTAIASTGCRHKSDVPTPPPAVRVEVMTVGSSDYHSDNSFSGTVAAQTTTPVSFSVAGTIEEVYVAEGQRVAKGQLLARLKSGDYTNANNIAQAELAEAQDAYDRLKKLHDANALPDIKWVEIQQKLKQARNSADISERALRETALYAPLAGVVNRKLADRGQNVAPIEPVVEIVSTDDLTIDISVPENEVGNFREGAEARVAIQGLEPLSGKVVQKAVVADPLTRSYRIKVSVPSLGGKVLPGMIGTVVFPGASNAAEPSAVSGAVMLPSQAVVLSDDNRTFVWIVKNGRAERRFVTSDELVAEGVIVKEGLAQGDSVIVAGMQKVGTGSPVEVVKR